MAVGLNGSESRAAGPAAAPLQAEAYMDLLQSFWGWLETLDQPGPLPSQLPPHRTAKCARPPCPQVARFSVFLQIGHKGLFARNESVFKRQGCAGRQTGDRLVSVPHQQLCS